MADTLELKRWGLHRLTKQHWLVTYRGETVAELRGRSPNIALALLGRKGQRQEVDTFAYTWQALARLETLARMGELLR